MAVIRSQTKHGCRAFRRPSDDRNTCPRIALPGFRVMLLIQVKRRCYAAPRDNFWHAFLDQKGPSKLIGVIRPISNFYTALPVPRGTPPFQFQEAPSEKLAWLQLRELADDTKVGLALFRGTRPQRNVLHHEFRNYLRQAKTYWDAARQVEGSASALLYYYGVLNLAKAELLQSQPDQIVGKHIRHGLSMRGTTTPNSPTRM